MKIIDIQADANSKVLTFQSSAKKLIACDVTFRNFWGTVIKKRAIPTSFGPTNLSGEIMFFIFTDELGEEYDYDISKQLNNYCFNYFYTNNLVV